MAERPPVPGPGEPTPPASGCPAPDERADPAGAQHPAPGDQPRPATEPTGAPPTSASPPAPADRPPAATTGAGSFEAAAGDPGDQPTQPTQIVGREAPKRPAPRSRHDDDATFLELVARFDDEPESRRWPAAEDLDEPQRPTIIILRSPIDPPPGSEPGAPAEDLAGDAELDERALPPVGPRGYRGDDLDGVVVIDLGATAGHDDADDDDHYVPPPPPPLPRMRPVTRWALGSLALGMVFLVVPSLIGLNQSRSQDVTGVLLILGGVGTLVARMGDRPPTDSEGPDDGAVI